MPAKGQISGPRSEETKRKISESLKRAYKEGRAVAWTKLNKGTGKVKGFTGKHTEETKAKISANRKGKCLGNNNGFTEGHVPHNKGKPHPVHTKEWREKTSAAVSGEKHWNWKGGISSENRKARNSAKHKEWSLAVLRRDRWQCQLCGYKGRELVAHHLKKWSEYPDLRFEITNGQTLCRACHCEVHKPRLGTGKSKPPKRQSV